SWLFGSPGAALFYCAAGVLVFLPEAAWSSRRLGQVILRVMGAFFIGMAVLQAWPGRGFWQGSVHTSNVGTLTAMVRQMAQTSQPGMVASAVRAFGRLDAAHGWAVNLVLVVLLGAIGVAFCIATVRVVRPALYVALALCGATWLFVQDLGVFGGVGTDPNSMVPMSLVIVTGYLAITRVRVPATADERADRTESAVSVPAPWWDRLPIGYLTRVLAAIGAVAVLLVGVVPMVGAALNPNADPILTVAENGAPNAVDTPAPGFDLVDQADRAVSLSQLRGRTVALTFLDPVCTSDCPVIAQEFRQAGTLLGSDSGRVVFVAIVANPIYRAVAFTDAFDRQEGLGKMRNWLFLTGSLTALERCWDDYGIEASVAPAGAMVAHSELTYLIDAHGQTREVLGTDPGNGSAASSSFSVLLANELERVVHL
ncbi:MAG TPA: SCO family protein, partial [Acidimicrobiales bacterium]|nr:SCO family protein [Acidimicrobiales bacterium]